MREAAFAGQFYPCARNALAEQIAGFFAGTGGKTHDAIAVVSPHAGYPFSGGVAAFSFSALRKASTYVVVSPNHTGIGEEISVFPPGEWETPLGRVKIDGKLAKKIAGGLGIGFDEVAHAGEHSIEVQLPFLQHLHGGDFRLVAITIAAHDFGVLKQLGEVLHRSAGGADAAFVASSDFTHYERDEITRRKDAEAIRLVEKMDAGGFHRLVLERRLSICGFAPICAVMECCRLEGIKAGKLLKYDTSASATGETGNTVGYASISFK